MLPCPPNSKKLFLVLLLSLGFLLLYSQSASAAPTVETLSTDMVFATQAQLFGKLIDLDGVPEVQVGFVYDTQYHADAADYAYWGDHSGIHQTNLMNGPGLFMATMPMVGALSPETLYHYRAATKNWWGGGITAYGEDMTFTTDTLDEPLWISPEGHDDTSWNNEARAYDDDLVWGSNITMPGDGLLRSDWLILTHDPIDADGIRFNTSGFEPLIASRIEVEVYNTESSSWERVYGGGWEGYRWRGASFGPWTVTKMRLRFVRDVGDGWTETYVFIAEVDFREYANTAPDAPSLVSPTNEAADVSIPATLSWTHSGEWGRNINGNDNTFKVYLDTNPNPTTLIGTEDSSTTSKVVSELENGTTYYWKVVADNGALSADSSVWSFTTGFLPCLGIWPSTLNFTATEGGSNPSDQNINVWNSGGGTLLWGSSDDQSSPNWLLTTDASLTSTVSIDISGLSVGTYNGTVTLFCDSCPVGDCQEKTVPVTLTVNPPCIDTAPDAPTLSSPSNGATGQSTSPTLDWNDISSWGTNCAGNDNDYEVLLDTNSNPTTSRGTEPGGSTSKLISGLDPGTTYYWKVRASNGVLSSDSPIWSFTTEPLPCLERSPSSLSFSATEGGSNPSAKNISISNSGGGTLSWGSSDDQSSPNWLLTTDASLTSTVSINISGLSAGTYNGTVTLSCSPLGSCQAGSCQQKTTSVTLTVNPGNSPPYVHTPSPGDGATNVSYTTDLSWIGGDPDPGDTVTYDVYFEAGDSTPDVLVSNNQSGTSYDPGTLNFSTLYYWKVVASDGSLTATGPPTGSWSFTTEDPPCLGVSPSSLSFTATVGTNPSTREIDVWNDGGGILLWGSSAEDGLAGDDWLVPVDGTGIVTVSIDIESTSLGAGEYTGTVTIACDASCPCATVPSSCESQDVAVTLTVTQATASISGEVWLDTGANAGDGNWDADEIAYTTTTLTLSRGGGNTVDTVSGGYDFGSFSISPPEAVTVTLDINTLPSGWGGTGVEFSDGTDCGTASTSCLVTLNNGDSRVINFGIWGVPSGWFQVIDGDIHSEGDIDNPVP